MKKLAIRLRKLEPAVPPKASPPNVLAVEHGETIEDALTRFRSQWPNTRGGHRLIVVPAIRTPVEFRIHSEARRAERRRAFEAANSAKKVTP